MGASGRVRSGWLLAGSIVVAALCLGAPLAQAQEPPTDPVRTFTFRGNVVDYLTESPIEGAIVQIADLGRSAEADANGYFEFPGLVPDRYTIVTASYGYQTNREPSDIPFGAVMVVRLNPIAIEVEGIEVEVDRILRQIEIRRLATPAPSSSFEAETLDRSIDLDVVEFVSERTSLDIIEDSFGLRRRRARSRCASAGAAKNSRWSAGSPGAGPSAIPAQYSRAGTCSSPVRSYGGAPARWGSSCIGNSPGGPRQPARHGRPSTADGGSERGTGDSSVEGTPRQAPAVSARPKSLPAGDWNALSPKSGSTAIR